MRSGPPGYKRNVVARSLRTGKTKSVGVSVGDITNSFYTDVVSIIQRVLHKAGYATMLCCNDSDATLQDEQVALMRDRMVDGLIISPIGDDKALRKVSSLRWTIPGRADRPEAGASPATLSSSTTRLR